MIHTQTYLDKLAKLVCYQRTYLLYFDVYRLEKPWKNLDSYLCSILKINYKVHQKIKTSKYKKYDLLAFQCRIPYDMFNPWMIFSFPDFWLGCRVWLSFRKSIAWRQNSKHWTENEWPWHLGVKWTLMSIAIHSCIMLNEKNISFGRK